MGSELDLMEDDSVSDLEIALIATSMIVCIHTFLILTDKSNIEGCTWKLSGKVYF